MSKLIEGEGYEIENGSLPEAPAVVEPTAPEDRPDVFRMYFTDWFAYLRDNSRAFLPNMTQNVDREILALASPILCFDDQFHFTMGEVTRELYVEMLKKVKPDVAFLFSETDLFEELPETIKANTRLDYDYGLDASEVVSKLRRIERASAWGTIIPSYRSLAIFMENPYPYLDFISETRPAGAPYTLINKAGSLPSRQDHSAFFEPGKMAAYVRATGNTNLRELISAFHSAESLLGGSDSASRFARRIKELHPERYHG